MFCGKVLTRNIRPYEVALVLLEGILLRNIPSMSSHAIKGVSGEVNPARVSVNFGFPMLGTTASRKYEAKHSRLAARTDISTRALAIAQISTSAAAIPKSETETAGAEPWTRSAKAAAFARADRSRNRPSTSRAVVRSCPATRRRSRLYAHIHPQTQPASTGIAIFRLMMPATIDAPVAIAT